MPFKNLREEIDTVFSKDPAARSTLEVVFCYPGFHSLLFYRVSHWLWTRKWLLLGRFVWRREFPSLGGDFRLSVTTMTGIQVFDSGGK